jgi:hypothetical protein
MMNSMDRLEQQLMTFSQATQYPPTPDLASGFWQRLGETQARRPARGLAFAGAVLAVIVLVVAVTFALAAPARDAAADLFHRINIFETSQSTEGLPTDITGTPTTLIAAETALGGQIAQPAYPENLTADHVLRQTFGQVITIAIFYRGDANFVLFASNASVGKGLLIGGTADVEPVDNLGGEAYWLTGRRIVESLSPNGGAIMGSERVTEENTLVWVRDRFVYRIEGNIEKDEAIRIAQSVR